MRRPDMTVVRHRRRLPESAGPESAGRLRRRWARIGGLVALAGGIGLTASMSLVGPDGHQRVGERTTGVGTSPGTGSRDPGSGGESAPPSADAAPGTAPGVAVRSFSPSYWSRWSNGPPADADWFPIGVFDNDPYYNDAAFKAAGLNLYLGLYDFGSQYRHYVTDGLVRHGSHAMAGDAADVDQVVADRVGRRRLWGYQPADEPEMKHYDVPDVRAAYDAIRAKDPTRPIFIGFGKGLSLPRPQSNYFLQGYEPREYCAVPDVTAADYYGAQDAQHGPDGQWVYGRTMDLMRAACDNAKPIWNFVDVEKVNTPDEPGGDLPAPTPLEIKQKVWLSIVHGATGIVYFCHDFGDRSVSTWDTKCLYDGPRTRAITETNALLTKYAAVLNSPTRGDAVTVSGISSKVTTLTKYLGGHAYVFAMSDGDAAHPHSGTTNATFRVDGLGDATVSVPEEGRSLRASGGRFTDSFGPYQWHIYRIGM